jgi:exopolysaccharide biosynthesis WecB/TagA/CpsF family protein
VGANESQRRQLNETVEARPPALVSGIPISDVTMSETLDVIGELVELGRRTGTTHQIATINVDFLVNALSDRQLRHILCQSDLCLADGAPVAWAAGLFGMPLRARVPGADLVTELARRAQDRGWRIHFFGGDDETAEVAERTLRSQFPGAKVSVRAAPFIHDPTDVDPAVLRELADVDADVAGIALGNPKQEYFIHANAERLRIPVMIGIGGSLDLLVGNKRRAPGWVRRIGFEWVVRALQEPRRLGPRYAHDIRVFGPQFIREYRRVRTSRRDAQADVSTVGPTVVYNIGRTQSDGSAYLRAADLISRGGDLRVDVGHDGPVRISAIAQLVGLLRLTRRYGGSVVCDHPDRLVQILESAGVRDSALVPGC